MHLRTSIGLSFLGFASLMSVACSNAEPTMRNVTGTVPTSDKVSSVVAVQVGNAATTYSAPVDASGHFSITLPIGQRFYLTFLSDAQTVGTLRYTSSTGALRSDINITHAPKASPSLSPASEGADDADESEDADDDSDDDGIEDDGIDLGDVDNPAGDDKYVPSQSPEQECDSDGDGEDDFEDGDDSGEHADDDADSDSDGVPDVVDTDDNNDGVPDA
ncbi:MAG TPA: hypothetical protein PKA58_02540 [Polyangium sp.]|nr:hypothetical protein [Polyangium sp.]